MLFNQVNAVGVEAVDFGACKRLFDGRKDIKISSKGKLCLLVF